MTLFSPQIMRAIRLTRMGMCWERAARAFWPAFALLAAGLAVLALGAVRGPYAIWVAAAWLLALGVATGIGLWRFRYPRRAEAISRVDARLRGRPLAALSDHAALGGEGALWQAHLAQMQGFAQDARPVAPDAGLARRDPFALRLAAMLALGMALLFGGGAQMGQGIEAIASGWRPTPAGPDLPEGASWEGWATPPAYTRRPTIYMNALPEGEALTLPKGSEFSFRIYGDATLSQTVAATQGAADPAAPGFIAEQSGVIEVAGRRFDVIVAPDAAPVVMPGAMPERRADGRLVQDFDASDDHGVMSGSAEITLDLASTDRRYGLLPDPEPRAPVTLDLPMPARGARQELSGRLVADLARHPWANLPVTVRLQVRDGLDQTGDSAPMQTILPGRRFFNPLASALIEVRRDLLWSRENAGRSAEILRAITWRPDGFVKEPLYLRLRGGVGTLEAGTLSGEARDELAQALWEAAIELEDGGLADALDRMQRAQEKLSEAIRNGANPDEIQRLMDELKEATDAYTRMLAEQGEQDPADRFTQNQPAQTITGDQIQQMMDEIQRLMNEGRMAEAQQLLEQFNRMMQNLRVTQGQGNGSGQGRGNGAMNGLADSLREQQRLSDEAFRRLQDSYRDWQRGQEGQGSQGDNDLADQQRDLRRELERQRGLLPGRGTEQGEAARRQLDQAGRAMEGAEQALREGDQGGALERQADAIEGMREGMRALGDMMAQGQQGGESGDQGTPQGDAGQSRRGLAQANPQNGQQTDPLGRALSGQGGRVTTGDPLSEGPDLAARARDLLDEIRRRSGERSRPEEERDYLRRLLDRF